jgi:hypothetical protein
MPRKPPAKRVSGLQAKSLSLFLSLYLNLFLSPPPLGGLRPPPARSRPPGIPPIAATGTGTRGNQQPGNQAASRKASERKRRSPEGRRGHPQRRHPQGRHPNEKDGLQRGGEATHNDGTPRGGAGTPGPRPPRERTILNRPRIKRLLSNEAHKSWSGNPATPNCTSAPGCWRRWSSRCGCSCSKARGGRISRDREARAIPPPTLPLATDLPR